MNNRFGSLFAGVGGFDVGFEQAGWECGWQVEIDPHCHNVLNRHWPNVPKYFDVTKVSGRQLSAVDCITFGSPCQDLSMAGQQAGLEGSRSKLFYEAVRIIKEMRDATENRFPRWAIWENVPGALTSNEGNDFAKVLDEMANIGALVLEWHVLDAQWFGVAQRRRRVYLVACFDSATAERCGPQILPVPQDSKGYIKQSRKKRKQAARTSEAGTRDSILYGQTGHNRWAEGGVTLIASDYKRPERNFALHIKQDPITSEETTPCITEQMGIGVFKTSDSVLRRLTPIECERLMGFPDDHTKQGGDGKLIAVSNRYKMCGNAVAVPVARWIASHLMQKDYKKAVVMPENLVKYDSQYGRKGF